MSPTQSDVIVTIAFHTGQLVLARGDDREFLRRLILMQQDLENFRRKFVPPRVIIDDACEDDEL